MHLGHTFSIKPFSHLPGTSTLLPGSYYVIKLFPSLIQIFSLEKAQPTLLEEMHLDVKGPVENFTVFNDLEKGSICVSGKTAAGWLRYHIYSHQKEASLCFLFDRMPLEGLSIHTQAETKLYKRGDWLVLFSQTSEFEKYQPPQDARLFFGNYKAQNSEAIKNRLDLTELFPIWHRLGRLVTTQNAGVCNQGTFQLLRECEANLLLKKPETSARLWLNLFQVGFTDLFVPQLNDSHHLGLISNPFVASSDLSPLALLEQSSQLIQKLFLYFDNKCLFILPHLLPEFHAGQLTDVEMEEVGSVSLEWSKKIIRRLCVKASQDRELVLQFCSNVKSYRLRSSLKDKGERKQTHEPISLEKNQVYFFDNFM